MAENQDGPYRGNVVPIESKLSATERIAAAQKKRDALRAEFEKARDEQKATDLEAIAELEAEQGYGRTLSIEIVAWKPDCGAPVLVAAFVPMRESRLAQRFIEQINRAKEGSKERLTAQDALATECWAYPPKGSEGFKAALELAPLILSHVAKQIVVAAQGSASEEGKES